jgi:hypothetical protein
MLVAYCAECLPGTNVVLGYSDRVVDLRTPHNAHPQTKKIGYLPLSYKEWKTVFVEGDETQTKANIVTTFGDQIG